jgi:hypothetical protein
MRAFGFWPAAAGPVFMLAACGGGGGEAATPGPVYQLKDYHQTYISVDPDTYEESLVLVNVANFGQRTPLGGVLAHVPMYAGTHSGGAIRDFRPHSLYYVQDSAWRRVDLRSSAPAPTQLSNDVVSALCSWSTLQPTFGDAAGAWLLYSKPGADAACETGDDEFRRVALSATATTTPMAGPTGHRMLPFYSPAGALVSLLAYDLASGTARLYGSNLTSSSTLATGAIEPLASNNSAALLLVNGEIRHLSSAGALSGALHTLNGFGLDGRLADDEFFYFSDPLDGTARVYRLALDGTRPSEMLLDGAELGWPAVHGPATLIGETSASIVLAAPDADGAAVLHVMLLAKSVPRTDPVVIQTLDGATEFSVMQRRAPVLYTTHQGSQADAHTINAAGVLTTRATSDWAGRQYPVDYPLGELQSWRDFPLTGAFRVDDFDPAYGHLNGTVNLIDLASGSARALTTVTEPGIVYPDATGSLGMAAFFGEMAAPYYYQFDVLSFDLDDGRLERHTNATPALEFPYAF